MVALKDLCMERDVRFVRVIVQCKGGVDVQCSGHRILVGVSGDITAPRILNRHEVKSSRVHPAYLSPYVDERDVWHSISQCTGASYHRCRRSDITRPYREADPSNHSQRQASYSRQAHNIFDGEMLMCIASLNHPGSYGTAYLEQLLSLLWQRLPAYAAVNMRPGRPDDVLLNQPADIPCDPKLIPTAV
jgi:hypothetical protein